MGALRARPGPLATPLDPLAQHLVDARLPAWSGGSEMPKHLRREVDVRMDLRVRLLRPAARTRERCLAPGLPPGRRPRSRRDRTALLSIRAHRRDQPRRA